MATSTKCQSSTSHRSCFNNEKEEAGIDFDQLVMWMQKVGKQKRLFGSAFA
jgi:hypothetical protein